MVGLADCLCKKNGRKKMNSVLSPDLETVPRNILWMASILIGSMSRNVFHSGKKWQENLLLNISVDNVINCVYSLC